MKKGRLIVTLETKLFYIAYSKHSH